MWFASSAILLLAFVAQSNAEVVKLQGGQINGTVGQSKSGRLFHAFYSIPYAEPPVGELRFKPPVAVKPWSGIKEGYEFSASCMQYASTAIFDVFGTRSEDCLYLNVFVPNELLKPSGKAAVMVWIHGGSFSSGSARIYNPGYFMDKDVILVTINYRLGVLGFFGMNNDVISGNFGMKDQTMALRWVQNNIASFGGDPGKVTLMGESAGAGSVHLHMFSPLSKGLFQKAILQSGSAFASWSLGENSVDFLSISGCSRNDSVEILKCLQSAPAEQLVAMEHKLRNNSHGILFEPMIESNVKNEPFLSQKPTSSSYQTSVPWICGMNSGEGALAIARDVEKFEKADKNSVIPLIWPANDSKLANTKPQNIVDFYFSSNDTGSNTVFKIINIITDYSYTYPLIKGIQSSRERQYVYLYDHRGSFSILYFFNVTTDLGVSHGDEISLMFRHAALEANWTPEDKIVSETLIKFWTNFAITGDPNGLSKEKLWKPTGPELPIEYLRIRGNSTTMEKDLFRKRFDFWDSILR